jgi:hypothetical protein
VSGTGRGGGGGGVDPRVNKGTGIEQVVVGVFCMDDAYKKTPILDFYVPGVFYRGHPYKKTPLVLCTQKNPIWLHLPAPARAMEISPTL